MHVVRRVVLRLVRAVAEPLRELRGLVDARGVCWCEGERQLQLRQLLLGLVL